MTLLTLTNMQTNIGEYAVLHDISLTVPEGGVFVLLGRNGAGKTTTLRSIMGMWRPSPGSVMFRGQDITTLHTADIARLGIAFVPENMGIFGGLTVEENMRLASTRSSTTCPRWASSNSTLGILIWESRRAVTGLPRFRNGLVFTLAALGTIRIA